MYILNKHCNNRYVLRIFIIVDVRSLSQNCIGGPELNRVRNKIQQISEETNSNLKKNVYQNYMQFIDAAKEISRMLFTLLLKIISFSDVL